MFSVVMWPAGLGWQRSKLKRVRLISARLIAITEKPDWCRAACVLAFADQVKS